MIVVIWDTNKIMLKYFVSSPDNIKSNHFIKMIRLGFRIVVPFSRTVDIIKILIYSNW